MRRICPFSNGNTSIPSHSSTRPSEAVAVAVHSLTTRPSRTYSLRPRNERSGQLTKIFLYDLSELSSVARAASFIAVGAAILAGGAVLQKLSARLEEARGEPNGPASGASAG